MNYQLLCGCIRIDSSSLLEVALRLNETGSAELSPKLTKALQDYDVSVQARNKFNCQSKFAIKRGVLNSL